MTQFLFLLNRPFFIEDWLSSKINNRIKGKIQLGKHLKQNVFKNKLTAHVCRYQEFGMDNLENRFLKKVLQFVISFKNTHPTFFAGNEATISELITYCTPYFELISEGIDIENLKNITINPFFKEYEQAIEIGKHILKRFSYNITETTQHKVSIPPFWIDMPKLFELYVYKKLQIFHYWNISKTINFSKEFFCYKNALITKTYSKYFSTYSTLPLKVPIILAKVFLIPIISFSLIAHNLLYHFLLENISRRFQQS